nr:hypothetical protein [Tanacetum cinerariifolium]
MEEMTAMTRRSHQRMMRMMIWTSRPFEKEEETEPFETDESAATPPPHPAYPWTDSEIVRLLAISSPPASPLSHWSSPPPQILFPPLPPILSPPSPVLSPVPPPSPIHSLGYRAAMIRLEDRPEVTLPPQERLGIALGPRYEVGESHLMLLLDQLEGAPDSIDTELGGYMREFETRVRQDTDEIYMRLDDEQTERQLLAGRLNMLFRDKRAHAYTRRLMETEARMSQEAWMTEIRELRAADRRRQTMILELLRTDHRRSTEIIELSTALQGQMTALQGQVIALQAQVTALQGQ